MAVTPKTPSADVAPAAVRGQTFRNPVIAGAPGTDHGDPFVIKYLDSFYLYHTGDTSGRRGVSVHRSSDLVDWEFQGYALEAADSGWAWSDLWAPEVVYERGVFYMYISATSESAGRSRSGPWTLEHEAGRRVGVARATSPLGPFVPDDAPLADAWSIDAHPFRDDDGSMWLFYNVRTDELGLPGVLPGTGTVCDRLLAPDRLEGRPVPVALPSDEWEGVPTHDWYWNEAPYVLKRRGRYYQMYSGGAFADDSYAIGIASSTAVQGPWVKDPENPIVRGRGRIRGPGHHSFVFGPDVGTAYAVYHGYLLGEEGRKVNIDRLFWAGDKPLIAGPTDGDQPIPPQPVVDWRIPHWRAEAWVRGSWVGVKGLRFELEPRDVWHQVEATLAHGRLSVRIGGVLRSSQPAPALTATEIFGTDGEIAAATVSSRLEDGLVHALPASSSYVWQWGGAGPLELSVAVKGDIELSLNGDTRRLEGDPERYRLEHLRHDGGAGEISVRAGREGATVADLFVHAR